MDWRPRVPAVRAVVVCLVGLLLTVAGSAAADPALVIRGEGGERVFTRSALLARPDVVDLTVPQDVVYHRDMAYRAVPLAALFEGLTLPPDHGIEAVAADGYVAYLPALLALNRDPARPVAYVAVEDPERPWPVLQDRTVSAGPLSVVWAAPARAAVDPALWPYQVVRLAPQPAPWVRWPAMAVDAALPAGHAARQGQELFAVQCMVCHRINHVGAAEIGPDLNLPMNPVEYFQAEALRWFIRDPAALRTWPGQQMPAVDESVLSDGEIDLIIAYLAHMAARRQPARACGPNGCD